MQTKARAAIASFLLAKAAKDLFPKIQLVGGFSESSYFSYDFLAEFEIDSDSLGFLADRMRELIASGTPVTPHEMLRDVAVSMFKSTGEWDLMRSVKELEKSELVSLVRVGNLTLPGALDEEMSAKEAGFVKLLGFFKEKILNGTKPLFRFRITGVAEEDQSSLKAKVKGHRAAEEKSHEKSGSALSLFEFVDGKPLFLDEGAFALRQIEGLVAKAYGKEGVKELRSPGSSSEDKLSSHAGYYLRSLKYRTEYQGSWEIYPRTRKVEPRERRGLWLTGEFLADTAYFFVPSNLSVKRVISSLQFIEKNVNISGIESRWLSVQSENCGLGKERVCAEWVSFEALIQSESRLQCGSQGKKTVSRRFALFYHDARQELWEGPSIEVTPLTGPLSQRIREGSGDGSDMVLIKATLSGSFERLIAFHLEKTGALPLSFQRSCDV